MIDDEANLIIDKMLNDCLHIVYKIDGKHKYVSKILKLKRVYVNMRLKGRKEICEKSNVALWVGDVLNDMWLLAPDYNSKQSILKASRYCKKHIDWVYEWSWPKFL